MIWQIALRNLIKNGRRTIITITAIGIGGLAMMLFGGFVTSIFFGVQTSNIQDQGQLQVYKKDYLKFGAADPDSYTIDNYHNAMDAILADPELKQQIYVITPQVQLAGIAGVAATDNSKTFIGRGVVQEDADKMRKWDGWNVKVETPATGLAGSGSEGAIVGKGMARLLGLCKPLNIPNCEDPPNLVKPLSDEVVDFSDLVDSDLAQNSTEVTENQGPQINLLAAADGAPNIVSVFIKDMQSQAQRAIDNAFLMMHFDTARSLLYGEDPRATSLLIQLNNPNNVDQVKARIQQIIDKEQLNLEVFTFSEVDPTFNRIVGMFSFIFGVVSLFLGIVIIFTITNTINLTVMERVNEIGTIRALGFRRGFVMRMFISESALIGLFGVIMAILLTLVIANIINASQISWTPPSNATPILINLMVLENPLLLAGIVAFLFSLAVLAAIYPTRKASRMNIVSSLHHA
ncbi:ABC transporter permease [Motiliproteus sp. MSK22-1]|uniref:ABC transporter permease n=1 Tax=Motiliproteus sp. MSK22-1 TaxID=1897630 RepID=UPI000975D9CA|nr:FtsX-like permease family protein [Motiliproteus sp. MSK22-1]OMH29131.1 hypothetical protein BGP75_20480 [Motiliproteus sp. MSK22-1]